ncbi:universal stress protein [Paenibacillus woosongensis]|uniref:Universal stress protein n=2 Tax=Paenibacillus woosongensis TaxID=307580 RepID=A0AA95I7S8_9BACL|nr:universal stress protein [Paenibacillus woosongensis]WHX48152.1 universal stress protein [Paenibacillus woosongensis]
MKKVKGRMDESILVCVYYGPNGERLIRRGHKMASMLNCPLYILTVDPLPYDEFDAEKSGYIERWKELAEECDVEEFILLDNEKRPTAKMIAEVAHKYNVTQIIIGQTAQNRWEEITKGSFVNVLLREITFVDLHIVSLDRTIKSEDEIEYEAGVRGYLLKEGDSYRLCFSCQKNMSYEGIFYKEIGTDFNNGMFKFVCNGITHQVHVADDKVTEPIDAPSNVKYEHKAHDLI